MNSAPDTPESITKSTTESIAGSTTGQETPGLPPPQPEPPWLRSFRKATAWLEDALLVLLLSAMIVLAAAQIFLRNLLDIGLVWGDPLLRVMVLWVGLLGAVVASRGGNHITIDLLSRYLPPRWQAAARLVTDLFTVTVCVAVSYYSLSLVQMDREAEVMAFANVPAWWVETVIPAGFAIMALRYLGDFFRSVRRFMAVSGTP